MKKQTKLICFSCGGKIEVVKGWESDKALVCKKCGEFCYFVGNVACMRSANFDSDIGWDIEKAKAILEGK